MTLSSLCGQGNGGWKRYEPSNLHAVSHGRNLMASILVGFPQFKPSLHVCPGVEAQANNLSPGNAMVGGGGSLWVWDQPGLWSKTLSQKVTKQNTKHKTQQTQAKTKEQNKEKGETQTKNTNKHPKTEQQKTNKKNPKQKIKTNPKNNPTTFPPKTPQLIKNLKTNRVASTVTPK